MSEADKMLLELGWEQIEEAFSDWYTYRNKRTGRELVFQNDYQAVATYGDMIFGIALVQAIALKCEELGW